MLKGIYTTRMSDNAKMLCKRFEKINSKPMKLGRMVMFLCTAFLVAVFACSTLVLAQLESKPGYTLDITNNGEVIAFENKPFIENGEVYVPLRELFTKLDLMEGENAKMDWNNGVVLISLSQKNLNEGVVAEYTSYLYKIEIGKSELVVNPEVLMVKNTPDEVTSVAEPMDNAPILRKNITYIPLSYAERMIERADLGFLSPPDLYKIEVVYSGETLSIAYPIQGYYEITQGFGKRIHPITGEEMFHTGIDFNADEGMAVFAGIRGKITVEAFDAEKGNYVTVSNENGIEITYCHLSDFSGINYLEGTVSKGGIVGYTGNTGMSTGPHLHMEVKINGEYVDPELYLEKTAESELMKAVDEQMPRTLERGRMQGYDYQVMDIDVLEDDSWATVTMLLTNDTGDKKVMRALYTKTDDMWGWQEMTVEGLR